MPWYVYLLQLLSGALLTNGLPHFVQGLSGNRFQSPFASPPGVGESPPPVNAYWGLSNLVGGAFLLSRFAPQSAHDYLGWGLVVAGALLVSTRLSFHFGHVRAKRSNA